MLAGAPSPATAQTPTAWLREINRDVWAPFTRGVTENVDSLYLAVHSRDYVRVQSSARLILDYTAYEDDSRPIMADLRARGTTLRLAVRFDERIANGHHASERGVVEVVSTDRDGTSRTFHTRFLVVSRKEGGTWKMLTEYHTTEGGTVGAADFQRGRAMDDVEAFRCVRVYGTPGETCG